jgi:hypothetical protein
LASWLIAAERVVLFVQAGPVQSVIVPEAL